METTKRKQIIIAFVASLVVIVIFGGIKTVQIAHAIAKGKAFKMPPESVTSTVVQSSSWPKTLGATASVVAVQGVTLSAEETGKITKIGFESGQLVKEGATLVEIDTQVEEANLKGAIALADQAKQSLVRAQTLRSKNANSVADLEGAEANGRETQAAVDSLKATIARKRIIAPFSGRTGIRLVNVGQYISPGTEIVPLHSLNPVYVNFSLPQQDIQKLKNDLPVSLHVDAYPDVSFAGTISTVNPQVDQMTRNLMVQAIVPNPEEKLRPGMFGDASITLPEADEVLAVPSSSIGYAPYGDTVWVIEDMKDPEGNAFLGVRQQVVKLGRTRGDLVAVTSGIKSGDQIVTSGTFKLHPNGPVTINNDFHPSSELAPKPADS